MRGALVAALCLAVLLACATAQGVVPEDYDDHQPLPMSGDADDHFLDDLDMLEPPQPPRLPNAGGQGPPRPLGQRPDSKHDDHQHLEAQKTSKPRRHHFYDEQLVDLHVLKIGPHANPSETYDYYSLPLCRPALDKIQVRRKTFKEALQGARPSLSLYELRFKEINELRDAVAQDYYFEFEVDGLPVRGFLGTVDSYESPPRYFLYRHLHFTFLYNNDQIIFANVTGDLRRLFELDPLDESEVEFSYSVSWLPTDISFRQRYKLQGEPHARQDLEIHWLSIMNSFLLVILLVGFILLVINRILNRDYSRYEKSSLEDETEDWGWKLVYADVFRFPQTKLVLCAFVGNGAQFIAMSVCILTLQVLHVFYPGRSASLHMGGFILYAFTAGIAGYVSSSYYKQMGGDKWAWNILLTATVFFLPLLGVAGLVNAVAGYYGTTTRVPFSVVVMVLGMWLFVGVPLTFTGGILGKRFAGTFYAPVRTKNAVREIPPAVWYRSPLVHYLVGGFLPFSAIYIELYYVFSSVWGHSSYTLYSILFLVFVILVIVTASITVALTYFQLTMEDHEWWWRSFISGGSTSVFIYLYSIFYFANRSRMSGLLQATFFFGYMAVTCWFFFLMLGTVGWFASLVFIRRIYKNLHTD